MIDLPSTLPKPSPDNPFPDLALALAREYLTSPPPRVERTRFNWILEQTRLFGKQSLTLAGAWRLSGEVRFAEAAWGLLEDALAWTDWTNREWSWDAECHFDLSTGEMAVNLATLRRWLDPWLGREREQVLEETVRDRILRPYLMACPPEATASERAWWWAGENNWNSVCNGGAAIAADLWQDLEESRVVEPIAWEGLEFFLSQGVQGDGSSLEGIGYWQYGTIYLLFALQQWERRHGRVHPALDRPAFGEGMDFPFDFSPAGCAIGFSDANQFEPSPALVPVLRRNRRRDLVGEVARRLRQTLSAGAPASQDPSSRYRPTEILAALHLGPDDLGHPPPEPRAMRVYPDCGWAVFRCREASLAFRAGSTHTSHAMKELLAINLARSGVALLLGCENHPYCSGWFNGPSGWGERRFSRPLFWEENSASKNTPLVNGIGQVCAADSVWQVGGPARMVADGTAAYPYFVQRISREVAVEADGFTVVDQWVCESPGWFEARFITPGEVQSLGPTSVEVIHEGERVRLEFEAGLAAMEVARIEAWPSVPGRSAVRVIRAFTRDAKREATLTTRIRLP